MRLTKVLSVLPIMVAAVTYSVVAKAEIGVGINLASTQINTSGTETLHTTSRKTSTSVSENVTIPSIFVEYSAQTGTTFGISYVPAEAEIGAKSVSKTDLDAGSTTTGTNKASAELSDHFTLYLEQILHQETGIYAKLGFSQVTVETTEKLATGDSYGNDDVNGMMFGLGIKRTFEDYQGSGNNVLVKLEAHYTDYDDISIKSTNGSTVTANSDALGASLSVGLSF